MNVIKDDHGFLEGEICGRNNCSGEMEAVDSGIGCSCHINPPCSHCVGMVYECNKCGFLVVGVENDDRASTSYKPIKPQYMRTKTDKELYEELDPNKFGFISIAGKYYWMEAKGKYPEGMTIDEILSKFNVCFGYKWLKAPRNGEFHLKYYTD